jgi:hypothetical protein
VTGAPEVDSLPSAVYAAPDDDAPREALARRLEGTPRGELLRLQLAASAGPISRAHEKRVRELLAAHGDEWLAPLRGALVKRSIRWERGFPVAGRLAAQRAADRDSLIGLPALATIRDLALELPNTVWPEDWLRAFVFAPPLRHVRVLRGLPRALLLAMLRAEPPFAIERLDVALAGGGGPEGERIARAQAPDYFAAFEDGRGLPRLKEIGLSFSYDGGEDPSTYAWLWGTELGRRVEQLSINTGAYAVAAWRDALGAHGTAMKRVVFFGRSHFMLERDGQGWNRLRATPGEALYPPERAQLEETLAALRAAGVVVT